MATSEHTIVEDTIVAFLKGLPTSVEEFVAADCRWTSDVVEAAQPGLGDLRTFVEALRVGFPEFDVQPDLETLLVSGERASFHFDFRGTNSGWFRNVGVTRRQVVLRGSGLATVQNSRITSLETHWNCARAMAQLGVRSHMRPDPRQLS